MVSRRRVSDFGEHLAPVGISNVRGGGDCAGVDDEDGDGDPVAVMIVIRRLGSTKNLNAKTEGWASAEIMFIQNSPTQRRSESSGAVDVHSVGKVLDANYDKGYSHRMPEVFLQRLLVARRLQTDVKIF